MAFFCAFHMASAGLVLSFYFTHFHHTVLDMNPTVCWFPRLFARGHADTIHGCTLGQFCLFFHCSCCFFCHPRKQDGGHEGRFNAIEQDKTRTHRRLDPFTSPQFSFNILLLLFAGFFFWFFFSWESQTPPPHFLSLSLRGKERR